MKKKKIKDQSKFHTITILDDDGAIVKVFQLDEKGRLKEKLKRKRTDRSRDYGRLGIYHLCSSNVPRQRSICSKKDQEKDSGGQTNVVEQQESQDLQQLSGGGIFNLSDTQGDGFSSQNTQEALINITTSINDLSLSSSSIDQEYPMKENDTNIEQLDFSDLDFTSPLHPHFIEQQQNAVQEENMEFSDTCNHQVQDHPVTDVPPSPKCKWRSEDSPFSDIVKNNQSSTSGLLPLIRANGLSSIVDDDSQRLSTEGTFLCNVGKIKDITSQNDDGNDGFDYENSIFRCDSDGMYCCCSSNNDDQSDWSVGETD